MVMGLVASPLVGGMRLRVVGLGVSTLVVGFRVSSSVCVACEANRGGGSKTRRGLLPLSRQVRGYMVKG